MKINEFNDLQREYMNLILHVKLEDRTEEQGERIKFLYNELKKRGLLTITIRKIKQLRVLN